jgi:hypothetical protein
MATELRAGRPGFRIPEGGIHFYLLQKRPYRLCDPRSLLFDGYQGLFAGGKPAGDAVDYSHYIVPML